MIVFVFVGFSHFFVIVAMLDAQKADTARDGDDERSIDQLQGTEQ